MVALHILKLLEDNGFGTIDTDLFFEKLTLDKKGFYIVSRGAPITRFTRETQNFDIYSRDINDLYGAIKLQGLLEFLKAQYGQTCDLPILPGISELEYKNVSIEPTSNIENVGLDANNRIIYVLSGLVRYQLTN